MNITQLGSRTGISIAAPTIEGYSNVDNISDNHSVYKGERKGDKERLKAIEIKEFSPIHKKETD